jgi:hypothetical protein
VGVLPAHGGAGGVAVGAVIVVWAVAGGFAVDVLIVGPLLVVEGWRGRREGFRWGAARR